MFIKGYLGRKTSLPVRGSSEISKHYRKFNLTTQVTTAAKISFITMQFFFSGRQKWFAMAMSTLKTRQEDLPIFQD